MRSCAASMHNTLWNTLTVEVRELLNKVVVFQGRRSALSHRAHVLVITNGMPLTCGQDWLLLIAFVAHENPFFASMLLLAIYILYSALQSTKVRRPLSL